MRSHGCARNGGAAPDGAEAPGDERRDRRIRGRPGRRGGAHFTDAVKWLSKC